MDLNSNIYQSNHYSFFRFLEEEYDERVYRNKVGLKSKYLYKNIPNLISMSIDSLVTDTCTSTTINQHYRFENESSETSSSETSSSTTSEPTSSESTVEASYSILLPPYATINSMQVEYNDSVKLVGVVRERNIANQEYNDAMASGIVAFMASRDSEGQFQVLLGNVRVDTDIKISFTIISEIGVYKNDLQFLLHRYWFPLGHYPVKINIQLELSNQLESLELPNYQYSINDNLITIESESGIANNILLLLCLKQEVEVPNVFIEYNNQDQSYVVALDFKPNHGLMNQYKPIDINQKAEFIFIIDCSFSMKKDRIILAKRVLQFLIRSLPIASIRFNIIRFGSTFQSLFEDGSKEYNDQTLQLATKYIDDQVEADLGGTDLYPVLEYLFSNENQSYDHQYPRQIFVLTDGRINDTDKLVSFVRSERSTSRMFTVGIGKSADKELVYGLASAGGGEHKIVFEDWDSFESIIMELLDSSLKQRISNLTLNWGELLSTIVKQAPTIIRPIYLNERMILYGIFNSDSINNEIINTIHQLELRGTDPIGNELLFKFNLDFKSLNNNHNNSFNRLLLHSIGSLIYISSLEKDINNKEEIINIAKKYNLITNYTSLIVTSDVNCDSPITEMKSIQLVDRIHSFASYWRDNNSNQISFQSKTMETRSCCNIGFGGSIKSENSIKPLNNNNNQSNNNVIVNSSSSSLSSSTTTSPTSLPSSSSKSMLFAEQSKEKERLLEIIKLQNANGSWSVDNKQTKVYNRLECPFDELKCNPDLWLTIQIIAKLEMEFKSMQSLYTNIQLKSMKWINQQLATHSNTQLTYELLLERVKIDLEKSPLSNTL
ncbi:Mast cell surface antigen-1 [Heterostelium album PN500]|uniref:Mast cell surface antigen-1 n=1 Tax=Heterostelium pallidum (strain ATCC 26659 / Pp 5 / PN500) TaxID=670386 RepID=D3BID2_HETP5|nr:Mast cell surface antigen-1 [Heterostelium album PN500]EFA79032.1 Mast cell surface antigen-1 [Heterostelium album PN500]|eukprot:XP_020431155.1 Mast cell surface antigen-1 [Heterostelium album PN500]